MMTLDHNEMVRVLDVTSSKSTHGIWSLSGPILDNGGSATQCVIQSVVLLFDNRLDNAAPFNSICEMHNAGHCAGAAHCNYNEKFLDGG